MKKLMILMMLVAMTAIAGPPADEEPEPSWGNNQYAYEAEIALGSKAGLVWKNVPVVWAQILPLEPTDHFYGIVVLDSNRRAYWSGETPGGETIKIGIHMPAMPHWWGFYRARFRPFPLTGSVGWSATSRWVMFIDLMALPFAEAFVAMPDEG